MSGTTVDVASAEIARVVAELGLLVVLAWGGVELVVAAGALAADLRPLGPALAVVALGAYAYWRLYHTNLGERLRTAVEELTGTEL